MKTIGNLIENHKLIRRATMVWSVLVVSISVGVFLYAFLTVPETISGPVATVFASIIGILGMVEAVYNYSRSNEHEK